jgi:hypothetical protein
MIVWLASYPRSGNTFLRIALNRLNGVQTSTVYDTDGVAGRLGSELIGAEHRPADCDVLRASAAPHFIKTHRQRDERIHAQDRAICLVRDGRDALVSYARLQGEQDGAFEHHLRAAIEATGPRGTGGWGANVLSWLQAPSANHAVLRYEDLIRQPAIAVQITLEQLSLHLSTTSDPVPTFAELVQVDPKFFRKGVSGVWQTEMPPDLLDLFWSRPDNRAAMNLLGYA